MSGLCCSELEVLCSPSISSNIHLEVKLETAVPHHAKRAREEEQSRRLSGMLIEMDKLFLESLMSIKKHCF